jgi:hypothetical protein
MKKLNDTIILSKLRTTANKLKNNDNLYLYEREDNCYEVFFAKIRKEETIFNVLYPERELYPTNEDFGKTAWCFTNLDSALVKYNLLLNDMN